ncbi:HotDog domain protein [Raphanus sativus]|nr:HotDog domain protein [Raphanus sativus]
MIHLRCFHLDLPAEDGVVFHLNIPFRVTSSKPTEELSKVFLETERLQQMLILHDTSLHQLIKEQTDFKASLDGAVKSILEELSKDPNQEKLQNIAFMLTAIPDQVETVLQKIQREICHKLTGEIQVLASSKLHEPAIAQVPTTPTQAKENFPEPSDPAAKLQSSAFCSDTLKMKQPQLPRNPDKASARTVKTFLSTKAQVGCWKTVKPAQRTFKNNAGRKQVKPVGTRTQFEQCSVVIDSDDDIDGGFSCLLKGSTKGAKFEWDAEKETERLLKTVRRTRRKFVVEFLGNVPLLQKLPSSSLKKIAQVVVLKRYGKGEYVIREEQAWDGCFFIFSGEAQVSGPDDEENRSEFLLKQYDYFGHGISAHVHSADIIATSELTCLVLPRDHCCLLQTNSIWQSDQEVDKCSLVERILQLDPLELNIFRGITLPDAPKFGKVFGGQFMGQALAAASKTVDFRKIVHSFHSYFLLVGDIDIPIIYQVHRIRDGNNFATRRVDAIQKGNIIFILMASFQKEQQGFDHQESTIPTAPDPDTLLSLEELRERRITDPHLPRSYRNKVATANFIPWPIEIRFCEPSNSTNQTKSPPRLRYWFRAKGKLSDDQALHRCVVAFASDLIFASISLNPHRRKGLRSAALSLDHAMWFHRPLRADDWLLFVIVSPTAHVTRGFVTGEMFNRKGELVVSLTQEALLREARPPNPSVTSKL